MDFLSGLAKSAQPKPSSDQPSDADRPASNSDLFGSAKVVAEAAQAQFSNQPDKYDKSKAAGAAADLLDAASEYGKLDETKGVGKYVDQAEGYLRQYGTPASGHHKAAAADSGEEKTFQETTDAEKPTSGGGAGDYAKKAEEFVDKPSVGDSEAGGAGDYIKKAEEFVDKPSGGGGAEAGGAGDYLKKAEEYLDKPSGGYAEAGGAGDYIKKAEEFFDKPSGGGAEAGGAGDYLKKAEEIFDKPSGDSGEKNEPSSESGGGYGGFMKAAGGFLNK